MRFDVVKPFDPWRSPLCTCPPKFVTNPYTGCGHRCLYCYASSYIPKHFEPRIKKDYLLRLRRDLIKIPPGTLIEMATSSDPYTPPYEEKLLLTRRAIIEILSRGFRLLITTKSTLIVRDLDVLVKYRGRVAVAITITTIDDILAKKLEPGAPPPSQRIKAVKKLVEAGIPVTVRVDPIIPYINDDYNKLKLLIRKLSEVGVIQVTSSTYKAKPDNFKRLTSVFIDKAWILRKLYFEEGETIHGYRYLPRTLRYEYMKMLKELVESEGLVFQTCREGFANLNTPGFYCDGSSYTFEDVYLELVRKT